MSKKYNYTICSKCGGSKPENATSFCNDCIYNRVEERKRELANSPDSYYSKCTKCLKSKSVTRNPFCVKCTRYKTKPRTFSNCQKCYADKKLNKSPFCIKCQALYRKERGAEQLERINLLKANRIKYGAEILTFIETLVNRNHWCSYEEIFMVLNYHILLFDFRNKFDGLDGFDQVALMYKYLCKFYKKQKMAFSK